MIKKLFVVYHIFLITNLLHAITATSANTSSTIVLRDSLGNFSAGTINANLSGNATSATSATTATTATNFTGSLSGDVTGTQSATIVSTVGGQIAANIASATVAANAATNANTASTIVKRDASGNFSAGTITASLSGNAATATSATTATNFTGSLSGDVTGTQGATVVSSVGGQTAANLATATVLMNAATNLNTANAIVKRDSTGSFAAQVISMTDGIHSGNLVLSTDPSTSTAGNIMKGSNRFIHDTGTSNTFMGVNAGNFTTSGTGQNTAVGVNALTANTTGNNNVAQGYNTLSACTTGSNNVALGSGAGTILTTGSNNIYIGATAGTASESNTIRIGTSGVQTACYLQGLVGLSISLSSVVVDSSTGKLGYLLSSQKFKKDIADMNDASSDILKLRPVTFVYRNDDTNTQQFGLIAEEVDEVFPAIVVYDEYGEVKTVQYHVLPVLLLNEMKKQHVTIKKMDDIIHDLLIHIQDLMIRVKTLENRA